MVTPGAVPASSSSPALAETSPNSSHLLGIQWLRGWLLPEILVLGYEASHEVSN